MKRQIIWKSTSLSALIVVLLAGTTYFTSALRSPDGYGLFVRSSLISPDTEGDADVTVTSNGPVAVRWRVSNVGSDTLLNPGLGSICRCQVERALPSRLPPGESADVVVRILPPSAGRSVTEIPVFVEGRAEPVTTLRVALNVPVTAPQWIVRPAGISLRSIIGHTFEREFIWDAIEKTDSACWLRAISLADPKQGSVMLRVDQSPWGDDGTFCLRKYRVLITPVVAETGSFDTQLQLSYSQPERVEEIWIRREVLPALLVVPAKMNLPRRGAPRMVTVVPRLPGIGAIAADFDRDLLSIRKVSADDVAGPATFEINAIEQPTVPVDAQVLFTSGDRIAVALPVRIDPDT